MKKLFLTFVFCLLCVILFAVDNIFDGSTDANSNVAANWSRGTVPTATDGYVTKFDATSPACTIAAALACNAITFSGYTNIVTMTFGITVSGDVIFQADQSAIIAGTGNLTLAATGSITSNGGTWNNSILLSGAGKTYTLNDDLTITGDFATANTGAGTTINGNTIYIGGSLYHNGNTTGYTIGTTNLVMNGTGTIGKSIVNTGSYLSLNLTINTAGTITFAAENIYYGWSSGGSKTITYTAGTLVTTGSTLNLKTCNLNLSGQTLNNVTIVPILTSTTGSTITLNSGVTIGGLFKTLKTAGENTILSSSGGTQRAFTLLMTGTQDVGTVVVTDMDCSAGQTIFGFRNTISNCINWKQLTAPRTVYGNL